jgi:hypothetical protein
MLAEAARRGHATKKDAASSGRQEMKKGGHGRPFDKSGSEAGV